jgi:hypothetical protein
LPGWFAIAGLAAHPAFLFPNLQTAHWISVQGKGLRGKSKNYRIIAENSDSVKKYREARGARREGARGKGLKIKTEVKQPP